MVIDRFVPVGAAAARQVIRGWDVCQLSSCAVDRPPGDSMGLLQDEGELVAVRRV